LLTVGFPEQPPGVTLSESPERTIVAFCPAPTVTVTVAALREQETARA
jgi:hypothetical protein